MHPAAKDSQTWFVDDAAKESTVAAPLNNLAAASHESPTLFHEFLPSIR
jgi:hypothetical protein